MLKTNTFLKYLTFILLLLGPIVLVRAQVTIGSSDPSISGALLDLKEQNSLNANSNRGLLLPRVNLEEESGLAPCVDEVAYPSERERHTGLLVYNLAYVAAESLCPGIYVWNSDAWMRLYGSCDAVVVSNLENEYVMDGQEYGFAISSVVDWEAIVSDPSDILISTSPLSGTKGESEFKFKLRVKMDADATVNITFSNKSDPNVQMVAAINGKRMTLVVPEDFKMEISGSTVEFPFQVSSNSSLPITVSNLPPFMKFDKEKQIIVIPGEEEKNLGLYYLSISNVATTKIVQIEMISKEGGTDPPEIIDPS